MKTEKKVIDFIEKYNMVSPGDEVTAALSGGADSVCLLLLLNNIKDRLKIKLSAVHVNHHIRGKESDRDAEFSKNICKKYGIKIDVFDVDCLKFAKEKNIGTEEAGRILRYDIFKRYKKIATAHTAQDNLETMLWNFMRGSGLRGLCGIPPRRDNIIRPLLEVERGETEKYVIDCGESFVTDSTNLGDEYSRNRIRHNLVPLMKDWNSSIVRTSVNTSNILRDDLEFIEDEADRAYKKIKISGREIEFNKALPRAVLQRCIIKFLEENGISYDFKRVETVLDFPESGGKLQLTDDLNIVTENGICKIEKVVSNNQIYLETELKYGKNTIYPSRYVLFNIYKDENIVKIDKVHEKSTKLVADYDKIKGTLKLRNRRFGDTILPAGREHHVKIKKWLQASVSKEKRPYIHYIEDSGGLIAVEGLGVSERVKIDKKTKNIVSFEFFDEA